MIRRANAKDVSRREPRKSTGKAPARSAGRSGIQTMTQAITINIPPAQETPVPTAIPDNTHRRGEASGSKSQRIALLIGQREQGQQPHTIIRAGNVLITRYPEVNACYVSDYHVADHQSSGQAPQ
jgi:hypothetical protein